jgi:hypothetical protein
MVSRRGTGLHLDLKTILTAHSRFEYLVTAGDEASTFCISGVLGTAGGLLDATTCIDHINAGSLSDSVGANLIQGNLNTDDCGVVAGTSAGLLGTQLANDLDIHDAAQIQRVPPPQV